MLLLNIHDYLLDREGYYQRLEELIPSIPKDKKIGFWGQPDQATIDMLGRAGFEFVDLDIALDSPDAGITPKVCCHIISDIVNNALAMEAELGLLIATSGVDKCDQGRNIRDLLAMMGYNVMDASNFNIEPIRPLLISTAKGPLAPRIARIMRLLYEPLTPEEINFFQENQCEPDFNYHGVPPQDFSLLDIFPETTHIWGWIRLVELGVPGMVDWEWQIGEGIPTVFYTQSFCNKEIMAKYLAQKHHGLHIDGHGAISNSVEAKLQAFLTLQKRWC